MHIMNDFFNDILGWIYASSLMIIILVILFSIIVTSFISLSHIKGFSRCFTVFTLISVLAILYTTVLRRIDSNCSELALIPFIGFSPSNEAMRMYVMNAFLFFPLGLFLPYIIRPKCKYPLSISILSALVYSIAIEASQYIFQLGRCETDDVIMNTLGAAIGTLSYVLSEYLIRYKRKKNHVNKNDISKDS